MNARRTLGAALLFAALACSAAPPIEWVRAGVNTNAPVWGIKGGLIWAIPPGGAGPRGLIRLYYPIETNGGYELINFIAVEPVVAGRRGFSELERSELDQTQGKRFWSMDDSETNRAGTSARLVEGRLTNPSAGVDQLEVLLGIERFDNGADVQINAIQRSDVPGELRLTVHARADSAPIQQCILTATMGNRARTRLLWLKNETVSSLKLYPDFKGDGFAPHRFFGIDQLARTPNGDVWAAVTTDEEYPSSTFPFPGTVHWYYGGRKVTQYWKKPAGTFRKDLQIVVNARQTYWMSHQPLPGGVAFENFELQEPFEDGQVFVFGLTLQTPSQLGFGTAAPAH